MMNSWWLCVSKKIIIVIASIVIVISVLLNAAYFFVNVSSAKNNWLSSIASKLLHQPIQIQQARIGGFSFLPRIYLQGVTMQGQSHAYLGQLTIQLNLLKSLFQGNFVTDSVVIHHLQLRLNGLAPTTLLTASNADENALIAWMIQQPHILLENMQIDWQEQKNVYPPIRHFDLLIENHDNTHIISAALQLEQTIPTKLIVIARLHGQSLQDDNLQGQLFISGKQAVISSWAKILKYPLPVNGVVDFQWWGDYSHQTFQHAQAFFFVKQLQLPLLFSHALPNTRLRGHLQWQENAITIDHLQLADTHLQTVAKAKITWQENQSPKIEIVGDGSLDTLTHVDAYLPDRILSPSLTAWLKKGLQAGRLSNIHFLFQGPLAAFPFDKAQGHFEVIANLNNVELRFNPQWPVIKKINGEMTFDNRSFAVTANNATIAENLIKTLRVHIDNVAKPTLIIHGDIQTNLQKALSLLTHSPLPFAKNLKYLQGNGLLNCDLHIELPLDNLNAPLQNFGTLYFFQNTFSWPKWGIQLENVTGESTFRDNLLFSKNLTATLFGTPITIAINHKKSIASDNTMVFYFSGIFNPNKLQTLFHTPFLKMFQGETSVKAEWTVSNLDTIPRSTLDIFSNLQGLRFDEDAPLFLAKEQQDFLPLYATISLKNNQVTVFSKLGDRLSGAFIFDDHAAGFALRSGHVRFGSASASFSDEKGVQVDGDLLQLNVTRWQQWLTTIGLSSDPITYALPNYLKKIELHIGDLTVWQQHWKKLLVRVTPIQSGTLLHLENQHIFGEVTLPVNKTEPIVVNLKKLVLLHDEKSEKNKKEITKQIDPKNIPALDVNIQHFRVNQRSEASVQFKTTPIPEGLLIHELTVSSDLMKLAGDGRWILLNDKPETTLTGTVETRDLGALLEEHHWSSRLKEGDMTSHFALSWPGTPQQFSLTDAIGRVTLNIRHGRILHLDSKTESNLAFGRLLNLFSMESIARFLSFHFSEFTNKGFIFDTLSGKFELTNETLTAHQVEVDASVAKIAFDGKIALGDQQNDLMMTVYPKVSDSLPVIIGLAGGPIAGVAAWFANKIVSPGVGHLMQRDYLVTGTLETPVVKRVNRAGIDAKNF